MPTLPTSRAKEADPSRLGDPALRRTVEAFVRRRVPPSDVEDVVQTVFCDALAAADRPAEQAELTRWLLGIARHKVADRHRRALREPPAELPEIAAAPEPIEARALVRWAERQVGDKEDAQKTLAWMAREGEGEKLDAIAEDEKIPPARVRQRVSRMRRWMKERWAAELAAVAVIAAFVLAAWALLRKQPPPEAHDVPGPTPTITPEPPAPLDRARSLRADALRACDRGAWSECLDGLDQARSLDPDGDRQPAIGAARANAERALRDLAPAPTSKSAPNPAPTSAPTPTTKPTGDLEPKAAPKPKASKADVSSEPLFKGSGSKSGTKRKRASSKVFDSPNYD